MAMFRKDMKKSEETAVDYVLLMQPEQIFEQLDPEDPWRLHYEKHKKRRGIRQFPLVPDARFTLQQRCLKRADELYGGEGAWETGSDTSCEVTINDDCEGVCNAALRCEPAGAAAGKATNNTACEAGSAVVYTTALHRLETEIHCLSDLKCSIFLFLSDMVKDAADAGCTLLPRGNMAASLLSYLLGITDIDPLQEPTALKDEAADTAEEASIAVVKACIDAVTQSDTAAAISKRKGLRLDLDYEVFLGFMGEKLLNIEFGVPYEYLPLLRKFFQRRGIDEVFYRLEPLEETFTLYDLERKTGYKIKEIPVRDEPGLNCNAYFEERLLNSGKKYCVLSKKVPENEGSQIAEDSHQDERYQKNEGIRKDGVYQENKEFQMNGSYQENEAHRTDGRYKENKEARMNGRYQENEAHRTDGGYKENKEARTNGRYQENEAPRKDGRYQENEDSQREKKDRNNVIFSEDIMRELVERGETRFSAYQFMEKVRTGRFSRDARVSAENDVRSKEYSKLCQHLKELGIPDETISRWSQIRHLGTKASSVLAAERKYKENFYRERFPQIYLKVAGCEASEEKQMKREE